MSARKAWKHKPKNQKVESEIPDTFNGSLSDVTEFPSLTKLIPKSTNQLDSKKIGEPKKVNEPKVSLETQLTQANGFKVVVTKITTEPKTDDSKWTWVPIPQVSNSGGSVLDHKSGPDPTPVDVDTTDLKNPSKQTLESTLKHLQTFLSEEIKLHQFPLTSQQQEQIQRIRQSGFPDQEPLFPHLTTQSIVLSRVDLKQGTLQLEYPEMNQSKKPFRVEIQILAFLDSIEATSPCPFSHRIS